MIGEEVPTVPENPGRPIAILNQPNRVSSVLVEHHQLHDTDFAVK